MLKHFQGWLDRSISYFGFDEHHNKPTIQWINFKIIHQNIGGMKIEYQFHIEGNLKYTAMIVNVKLARTAIPESKISGFLRHLKYKGKLISTPLYHSKQLGMRLAYQLEICIENF